MKAIATLETTVGPKCRRYSSSSLSVSVPDGVVSEPVNINIDMYVDKRLMPPSTKANYEYIVSPLYAFEPHGLTFSKHMQVHFPPLVDSNGWHLSLIRAKCDTSTTSQLWEPQAVLTYISDLDKVNVKDPNCRYDLTSGTLSVKHFCWHW